MKLMLRSFSLLLLVFMLISSCSDPKLDNPFDPESGVLQPMAGDLGITQLTDGSVKLTWQLNNSIKDSYVIYRKTNDGSFQELATVENTVSEYTDTGLLTANTYTYQVIGKNDELETEPLVNSISTSFREISDFEVEQQDLYTVKLTWVHDCSYETGYIIERRDITSKEDEKLTLKPSTHKTRALSSSQLSSKGTNLLSNKPKDNESKGFEQIADLAANNYEYIDENLTPNHIYEYRINAYSELNVSPQVLVSQEMVFPAPTDLQIVLNSLTSCTLSWQQEIVGEEGYKIDRKKDEEEWIEGYQILAENAETFTETDLTAGSSYQYKVYAYCGEEISSSLGSQIEMTFPAPTDLDITLKDLTTCELSWNYSGIGDEDGFKVKRRLAGGSWTEIAQLDINTTYYEDTGLTEEATYEYMVYAYNFELAQGKTVTNIITMVFCTDIDGNVYEVVKIGDQYWMAENLKVTHYRNGDQIPNMTSNGDWTNTNSGAYCFYDNEPANAYTYGALYNWYAVDDERGLAPEGWHVPTDEEISELTDYLGNSAGSQLAWNAALWNDGALENDPEFGSSGFSFLPGGYRIANYGYFWNLGSYGTFWSATEHSTDSAWGRDLDYNSTQVTRYASNKRYGFSVRCLRD